MSKRYLALLRGINVGGNNIIKMTDLKSCFERLGFTDVRTYIQSGNVLFSAKSSSVRKLELEIETALSAEFQYKSTVVVISREMMKKVMSELPKGFGTRPLHYRYDVVFFKKALTPQKALKAFELREGVDSTSIGTHAIYFTRLIKEITKSRISKVVQKPEYQFMTIRNWNTTSKLHHLITEAVDRA